MNSTVNMEIPEGQSKDVVRADVVLDSMTRIAKPCRVQESGELLNRVVN